MCWFMRHGKKDGTVRILQLQAMRKDSFPFVKPFCRFQATEILHTVDLTPVKKSPTLPAPRTTARFVVRLSCPTLLSAHATINDEG